MCSRVAESSADQSIIDRSQGGFEQLSPADRARAARGLYPHGVGVCEGDAIERIPHRNVRCQIDRRSGRRVEAGRRSTTSFSATVINASW